MKKFLIIVAMVSMVSVASAQGFSWGPKVGMNVSNITDNDLDARVSFVGGLTGEYGFTKRHALSLDLLYSIQGARATGTIAGQDIKYISDLQYINVPILYNFYIIDGLAIKAGIQPGFLVSGRDKVKSDSSTASTADDNITSVDFSIPIGVSYEFGFGLRLDARYNIGVSNVYKEDFTGRNSVFALTVGWMF